MEPSLAELAAKVECLDRKIEGLATKEDIREVLAFMRQVDVGIGIFRFTWNNASKIGSFLLLIAGIFIFLKYGFMAMFGWMSKNL